MRFDTLHGRTVLFLDADGPTISTPEESTDLIGDAWSGQATLVAVPADRFARDFFVLQTRFAGDFIQKFVNYRLQLAVLGDIEEYLEASGALRDFVWESNRGEHVWFLADEAALEARLATRPERAGSS
jgi:hypothetical protein